MRIKLIGTGYGWFIDGAVVRAFPEKRKHFDSGVRIGSNAVTKMHKRGKGTPCYYIESGDKFVWKLSDSWDSFEVLPPCKTKPKRRRGAVGGRKF